jgi:hypothetical protein
MTVEVQSIDPPADPARRDAFTWSYTAWWLAIGLFYVTTWNSTVSSISTSRPPACLLRRPLRLIGIAGESGVEFDSAPLAARRIGLRGSVPGMGHFLVVRGRRHHARGCPPLVDQEPLPGRNRQEPACRSRAPIEVFSWGQTGGAGVVNIIYTLVFDESDEIGLPSGHRSPAWKQRAVLMCPGTAMCSIAVAPRANSITVERLAKHFFLVSEIYQ